MGVAVGHVVVNHGEDEPEAVKIEVRPLTRGLGVVVCMLRALKDVGEAGKSQKFSVLSELFWKRDRH